MPDKWINLDLAKHVGSTHQLLKLCGLNLAVFRKMPQLKMFENKMLDLGPDEGPCLLFK